MTVKRFIDANVILCYLLEDVPQLHEQARAWIDDVPEGSLILTPVIVAEIIYILFKYDYSRQQVAEAVNAIIALPSIETEDGEAVLAALRLFAGRNLDFADCYILERLVGRGMDLATFDKKLQNVRQAR